MTDLNREAHIKGNSPFAADKQIAANFNSHSERLSELENAEGSYIRFSTDDVSDPPSDAELDAAFGTPANLGEGFIATIDDDGLETDVWIVTTTATAWQKIQLTVGAAPATAHSTLSGLGPPADDHPQYFLLAGETTDAQLHSGADLIVYSDAGVTERGRLRGGSGTMALVPTGATDIISIAGASTGVARAIKVAGTFTYSGGTGVIIAVVPTIISSNNVILQQFQPGITANAGTNNISGVLVLPTLSGGSATVTNMSAIPVRIDLNAGFGGTVINLRNLTINAPIVSGGSITNFWGIDIGNISAGGTLNFAIRTALGDIQFGDQVSILGSGAADIQLLVKGAAAQSANFQEWQDNGAAVLLAVDNEGVLTMAEITTPTADTNFGKIYTKTDNKLYFQDGAGTEHEVAFV